MKIEIISSTLSDHNAMKLEINHRKNIEKHQRYGSEITCYETTNGSQQDQGRNQKTP